MISAGHSREGCPQVEEENETVGLEKGCAMNLNTGCPTLVFQLCLPGENYKR